MKTKALARFAILTAAALVLGYMESLFPLFAGMPGIKLGLSNTVLLYAIYILGGRAAAALMVLKVLLSGLLFSGLSGMLYSLAGGVLSLAAMLFARRIKNIGTVGVSVLGAVAHNAAQIAVACLVTGQTVLLFTYFPFLLLSAAVTGTLTGIAAKYVIKYIGKKLAAGKK